MRTEFAILSTICLVSPANAYWGYCSAEGVGRKVLYVSAVFSSNYFNEPGMEIGYRRFLASEGILAGPAVCLADQDEIAAITIRNHATDMAMKNGYSVQPFGPL